MSTSTRLCALFVIGFTRLAFAHGPEFSDGGLWDLDGGSALTPPFLKSRVDSAYPPEALAKRIGAAVGMELLINEDGKVVDIRVTQAGGHGFDEAAVAAAKQYLFEPARHHGVPTPVVVKYVSEFTPPPEASVPAATPANTTVVLGQRPISAASSFSVRDRDFQLRPIGSVQDILRVTPGLVMVQHSGGGKANQYFLRGFDADHGTDLALSIDGVPINMVSHAHGQGFADTNFIIPEVVEKVEVTKGPYFANQGDFATAGTVNMTTRTEFEHSSVGLGFGGTPGQGSPTYRALLIASPKFDSLSATFAVEVGRANGPFDNPENWNRYKLFNKLTFHPTASSELSVTEMSYGGDWHGSGQIPARAVDQGLVSRFGSIDPAEGGATARHQLALQFKAQPTEKSELKAMAYVATYRFNLFSNFTLFLRDPDNGDEIEQIDRRVFYGAQLSYRIIHDFGSWRFDTKIGADLRSDDIHEELWSSVQRRQLSAIRGNDVHETFIGAYLNEEIAPFRWLRVNLGGRADSLSFAVDNRLPVADPAAPISGVGGAAQFSPKLAAVVSPLQFANAQLELFVDYGHGFHSNDVRGAFARPSVTPLTRAVGEELGARGRFWNRWDIAASLWQLDLAGETVWAGDEGTTGVNGPTHRQGLELETRFEFTSWLAADLDVTLTKSQFSQDRENGGGLALAPRETWSGGVSGRHALGPGIIRGGLRFYGIGDRPATDDGALVAPGFTQFDLHLGFRHRRFDVALDIENLFNGSYRAAQFATVSRLRTEPALGAAVPGGFSCGKNARLATAADGSPANGRFYGCEDVDSTPAYPFTARLTATFFLD